MDIDRHALISDYLKKIKSANKELTKKEIFKDLLNRLYTGDKEIEKIIDAISIGAETAIVNIPRKDKIHRGSADTLYNNIIIEFENDLKASLAHAKEQLAGYMLGRFKSGIGYNYTLIASDFITWKVFAPDISCIEKLGEVQEDELILNEIATASFVLTENNTDDFYYWIDRFLFKEEKQRATLKKIEEAFGYQSNVFIESIRELTKHFYDAKRYSEVQVSYEQWGKFLSFAYGTFDASEKNFLIHTYLSVFSKMLAYTVVSNDDFIDDDEMKGVLNGSIFNKYNIRNFIDNDFFHWVGTDRSFQNLKKVFRLISQEISTFEFTNVEEDILKGVYQELIDLDTRHSLGEYYTPDWLCERIVNEYDFTKTDKILDPACGSGSFLRAAIHRLRTQYPGITAEEINKNIYGIDIHPLSVQIAKTTMLLALGKEITNSKRPVYLNIILANTLHSPEGVETLFGGNFIMQIDKEKHLINTQILGDVNFFDDALDICEKIADQSLHKEPESAEVFEAILSKNKKNGGLNQQIIDDFYKVYLAFKKVKESGRDSIWKFIVQNLYKPYFLSKRFDYVIGNPPWFTYSSIKNEEYQNTLNELAIKYNVKPASVSNFPHLEIAAIFLAYCSSYFLKENGKIAFVLPRSFFSADHHDNTRAGKASGFRLTNIWDLIDVNPMFRIPSCVLFAEKTFNVRKMPASGVPGLMFKGRLPSHNCNYIEAIDKLTETDVKYYYGKLGKSTAFVTKRTRVNKQVNPYAKLFKQGATIVPRVFYFVDLDQEAPPDFNDRIVNIKTAESIKKDAKKPWNAFSFSGQINSQFLFRTAISKNILPFALLNPELIVLPVQINIDNETQNKSIKLYSPTELMREGYLDASKWFQNTERIWNIQKTEKN
ncbi:MAG: N-6 DNA methylase, partial [bacterium]